MFSSVCTTNLNHLRVQFEKLGHQLRFYCSRASYLYVAVTTWQRTREKMQRGSQIYWWKQKLLYHVFLSLQYSVSIAYPSQSTTFQCVSSFLWKNKKKKEIWPVTVCCCGNNKSKGDQRKSFIVGEFILLSWPFNPAIKFLPRLLNHGCLNAAIGCILKTGSCWTEQQHIYLLLCVMCKGEMWYVQRVWKGAHSCRSLFCSHLWNSLLFHVV